MSNTEQSAPIRSGERNLSPVAGEKLLSIEALAAWLDVPAWTVRKWRAEGKGPRGLKVGRWVRYRPEDVKRWLDELAKAA